MIRKKEGFDGQRAIVLPKKIVEESCVADLVIQGAYITDIGYYPRAKYHYRQRLEGIDQHILIYCQQGKGWTQIEDKKYFLEPDMFVIIPAGLVHSYAADDDDSWTIYWAHFKGPLADEMVKHMVARQGGHTGSVSFQLGRIALFEDIYASLERGYGHDNVAYANMCLWHFLATFLYDDQFSYAGKNPQEDVVEQSISYMQEQLSGPLTLAVLAKEVNRSASHYSAIFRKRTGFSPMEYFSQLKIQKACQYLVFTDMRIKEIAYKLGMADPYYFSRMFSRMMGVSPEQYRAKRGV